MSSGRCIDAESYTQKVRARFWRPQRPKKPHQALLRAAAGASSAPLAPKKVLHLLCVYGMRPCGFSMVSLRVWRNSAALSPLMCLWSAVMFTCEKRETCRRDQKALCGVPTIVSGRRRGWPPVIRSLRRTFMMDFTPIAPRTGTTVGLDAPICSDTEPDKQKSGDVRSARFQSGEKDSRQKRRSDLATQPCFSTRGTWWALLSPRPAQGVPSAPSRVRTARMAPWPGGRMASKTSTPYIPRLEMVKFPGGERRGRSAGGPVRDFVVKMCCRRNGARAGVLACAGEAEAVAKEPGGLHWRALRGCSARAPELYSAGERLLERALPTRSCRRGGARRAASGTMPPRGLGPWHQGTTAQRPSRRCLS